MLTENAQLDTIIRKERTRSDVIDKKESETTESARRVFDIVAVWM